MVPLFASLNAYRMHFLSLLELDGNKISMRDFQLKKILLFIINATIFIAYNICKNY
jgi:hypothetical protein